MLRHARFWLVLLVFSEIMSCKLDVGDCCFGHVKGYPWWPAKITEKTSSMKKNFCVVFYGTQETAWLSSQDIQVVSKESVKKLASPGVMKRKHFESGLREMISESSIDHGDISIRNVLHEINDNHQVEVKGKCSVSSSIQVGANGNRSEYEAMLSKALDAETTDRIELIIKLEVEDDIDDAPSMPDSVLSLQQHTDPHHTEILGLICDKCSQTFSNMGCLKAHYLAKHENEIDSDEEQGIEFGKKNSINDTTGILPDDIVENMEVEAPEKVPENPTWKAMNTPKKVAKNPRRKEFKSKIHSLREQHIDNDKKFTEFVEEVNGGYSCKICKNFSTITKLLARAHVVSCSKKRNKKRGPPIKNCNCLECGQIFSSKKDLNIHHKKEHVCNVYTCSTCLKQFNHKPAYVKHVRSHTKATPKIVCTVPDCGKTFRFRCDMDRHLAAHERSFQLAKKVRFFSFFNLSLFQRI